MPASTPSSSRSASSSAENKKAQDRCSKEEEKLLVQLWAEIKRRSQHGVVFCSQILFLSATVAFRTNFCHWPISSRICPEQIWNCPLVRLGPNAPIERVQVTNLRNVITTPFSHRNIARTARTMQDIKENFSLWPYSRFYNVREQFWKRLHDH